MKIYHGGGQLLEGCSRLDEDEGGRSNAKEGSSPEGKQGDANDGGDDVDEPVGEERGDSEEENVGEEVGSVSINFGRPLGGSLGKIMSDKLPTNKIREKVAERST